MSNPFYTASGTPGTGTPGASAGVRSEYLLIQAAFDKLPTTLTANALVVINAGGTGLTALVGGLGITQGGTGATTKAPAFDALSPMTTGGDIIYGGASGTGTRLANGTAGQVLQSNGTTLAPTWVTLASGGGNALTSNPLSQFAATTSAQFLGVISDETGTGLVVFNNGPTFIAPIIGTPASGNLSNCTALPIGSITGFGTNVATFLATPTSANLAAAITNETGSGALVFATSPTLVTPLLGTPTSGVLTNCTGLPNASVIGLGNAALKTITISTSAPSGGSDGDIWLKY